MKKYSILSYEQMSYNPTFYKEQLSVFDIRTQVLAELTDLAILQGARVANVNYSKSFFHRDRELILRTKKGWTGPKEVDGKQIENTFRAHQVPIVITPDDPTNIPLLYYYQILSSHLVIYHHDQNFQ